MFQKFRIPFLAPSLFAFVGALAAVSMAPAGQAQVVYKKDGKSVQAKDLSPALRQSLFDIEFEAYKRKEAAIQNEVLQAHVAAEAKKKKISKAQAEAALFKVKEPTDKDAEKWFKENKDRMPPNFTFEQIKGDIRKLLKAEAQKKQRKTVLDDLTKKHKITLAIAKPQPPRFEIDVRGYPQKGSPSAKVTLVEFADYQCPHCQEAGKIIKKLLKSHGKKFKLVYIDFPINRSGISTVIAEGAFCARQQGKYWEFHDKAFAQQKALKKESAGTIADSLKLDRKKFDACLKGSDAKNFIAKSKELGDSLGVGATPTLFLNGRKVMGHSEEVIKDAIEEAAKNASS